MDRTRLTVDPAFAVAPVDRRIFGSFVEHMGRCVYGGVFEPDHPDADEAGLRRDVLDLTREMGVTIVRYPGGNFVSGYRWEDGIGPVEERPTRLDLAWRSIETNAFGLHEFMHWTQQAAVEPMLAVNLGTRGIQEAADVVEYVNHPGGTALSDLRRKNGAADPFGVKVWCLGNEMDGPWQVGQKSADDYGKLAAEAGKAMKLVDPTIELVACGSSGRAMDTFGSWEADMLRHTYEHVDYVSLHAYYEQDGDLASFLGSSADMDGFIREVIATCDHIGAVKRSRRRLRLSFDEWNVWNQKAYNAAPPRDWQQAPSLIEDNFTVADAVVVGSYLITLLQHADRVGIACQAQLANIIAPIRTEPAGPAWRQTIFHPFALTARHARGTVLTVPTATATVHTARYGDVASVLATATFDGESGLLSLFIVNRDTTSPHDIEVDLRWTSGPSIVEHQAIWDDDVSATNSASTPDRVRPRPGRSDLSEGHLRIYAPPTSFHTVVLSTATGRTQPTDKAAEKE